MAVIRINKTENYTVMSNYHFKDKNLSLKAKGLLSLMLSLPDTWDYSISGLVAICKESETSIKSTLDELKTNGYLVVTKLMPNQTNTGRYEYIYDIFEMPKNEKQDGKKQEVENLGVEFLGVEIQGVENVGQLNTKELNTKKSSTKELNTNNNKESKKETFDDLINNYTDNEELRSELKEHLKVRKKKVTKRALELSFKKLDELTQKYPFNRRDEYKLKIVRRSIEYCWIGFFELDKKQNNEQQHTALRIMQMQKDGEFDD